jgi:predicted site-specific integrase-resolvase
MAKALTVEQVRALPAVVDLEPGGRSFGISRSTALEMARDGTFPVPVMKIGHRYRVRRSDIVAALGLDDN